jgi:hypothetical protein
LVKQDSDLLTYTRSGLLQLCWWPGFYLKITEQSFCQLEGYARDIQPGRRLPSLLWSQRLVSLCMLEAMTASHHCRSLCTARARLEPLPDSSRVLRLPAATTNSLVSRTSALARWCRRPGGTRGVLATQVQRVLLPGSQ